MSLVSEARLPPLAMMARGVPPQRVVCRDAEVATDIGDGADRAAAHLVRDFCRRGQTDDAGLGRDGAGVHLRGGARLGVGRGAHRGRRGVPRRRRRSSLASSAAARSRPRVMRARMSAMSMVPKFSVMSVRLVAAVRCCSVVASCLP